MAIPADFEVNMVPHCGGHCSPSCPPCLHWSTGRKQGHTWRQRQPQHIPLMYSAASRSRGVVILVPLTLQSSLHDVNWLSKREEMMGQGTYLAPKTASKKSSFSSYFSSSPCCARERPPAPPKPLPKPPPNPPRPLLEPKNCRDRLLLK